MSGESNGPPSPLTVGKHFVKQYYNVLQTSAEQIYRFYQPSSLLSHAEGSNATDPSGLEGYEIAGRWGIIGDESKGFAIKIGAIDAQPSSNGSILLVVTGSFSNSPEEAQKTFIHTFFLSYIPNTKRFYVANDVLRFLEETATSTSRPVEESVAPEVVEEPVEAVKEAPVVELKPDAVVVEESAVVSAPEESSPGGGVEESKEEAPEEDEIEEDIVPSVAEVPVAEPELPGEQVSEPIVEKKTEAPLKVETKEGGKGKRGKGKGAMSQAPKQQPAAPNAVPGSWASLVASRPVVAAPVPPNQSRPLSTEKPELEKASAPSTPLKEEPGPKDMGRVSNRGGDRNKRDPDCTLVIKNLPDGAKDSELVALFEGFAASTGGKIVGTTVSVHRGLGFVDYDSLPPVMAAVAKHQESPIELHGRVLEVDQKTAEQKARRNARGGSRSGSPGNGGAYRGGGGRGQYRRGGGGRGGVGGRGHGGK